MALMGLFKSRQQREMEMLLKFRQGKSRISRFVQQAQQSAQRYWNLAKQAYQLGDQEQFRQLATGYVRSRESINRWERYLIKLDALELRRNEVASTGEFLKSIEAMTGSILQGAKPEEIARMQMDLEKAMLKTDALEQTLDIAMEAAGDSLTGSPELNDDVLQQISVGMGGEPPAITDDTSNRDLDARLQTAMKEVEGRIRNGG